MQGATSSSSRLTGTITRQKTLGVLLLRLQCMLHLCGEKPHTNIGLQFPGRNSQPNISRSVSIPRLQCMLHLCGNDPHKSTHKHQPYTNCHAMVCSSGRIPRSCYLSYSACYMFGCEAPSKGIDGGDHRVNKIGDACQSEPCVYQTFPGKWDFHQHPVTCSTLHAMSFVYLLAFQERVNVLR